MDEQKPLKKMKTAKSAGHGRRIVMTLSQQLSWSHFIGKYPVEG